MWKTFLLFAILGVGFVMMEYSSLSYVSLFKTKFSESKLKEISIVLDELGVDYDYHLVDGIKVHPEKQRAILRTLVSLNLLRQELYQDVLGSCKGEQPAPIKQQILEADITRTLENTDGVQEAMVKLALPDMSYFKDGTKRPTARVFLNLTKVADKSREQVLGWMKLVASSVPQLAMENVVLVDSNGRCLTGMFPKEQDGSLILSGPKFEILINQEKFLQRKAQRALDRVLPDKTAVTVNLELDLVEVEEETFHPIGAANESSVVEKEIHPSSKQAHPAPREIISALG